MRLLESIFDDEYDVGGQVLTYVEDAMRDPKAQSQLRDFLRSSCELKDPSKPYSKKKYYIIINKPLWLNQHIRFFGPPEAGQQHIYDLHPMDRGVGKNKAYFMKYFEQPAAREKSNYAQNNALRRPSKAMADWETFEIPNYEFMELVQAYKDGTISKI
jgi:hypothetical protein